MTLALRLAGPEGRKINSPGRKPWE